MYPSLSDGYLDLGPLKIWWPLISSGRSSMGQFTAEVTINFLDVSGPDFMERLGNVIVRRGVMTLFCLMWSKLMILSGEIASLLHKVITLSLSL